MSSKRHEAAVPPSVVRMWCDECEVIQAIHEIHTKVIPQVVELVCGHGRYSRLLKQPKSDAPVAGQTEETAAQ
jgi:hypothetical protein